MRMPHRERVDLRNAPPPTNSSSTQTHLRASASVSKIQLHLRHKNNAFLMEEQQRKRRPAAVTYGKSGRNRLSAADDFFSSPLRLTDQKITESTPTKLSMAFPATDSPQETIVTGHAATGSSRAFFKSATDYGHISNKLQTAVGNKRSVKTPPAVGSRGNGSAVGSSFGGLRSGMQPFVEIKVYTKRKDHGMFDVPSSNDEEEESSGQAPTSSGKRKRATQAFRPPRNTPPMGTLTKGDELSFLGDGAPKSKRIRVAQPSAKPEQKSTKKGKMTNTVKVKKARPTSERSKDSMTSPPGACETQPSVKAPPSEPPLQQVRSQPRQPSISSKNLEKKSSHLRRNNQVPIKTERRSTIENDIPVRNRGGKTTASVVGPTVTDDPPAPLPTQNKPKNIPIAPLTTAKIEPKTTLPKKQPRGNQPVVAKCVKQAILASPDVEVTRGRKKDTQHLPRRRLIDRLEDERHRSRKAPSISSLDSDLSDENYSKHIPKLQQSNSQASDLSDSQELELFFGKESQKSVAAPDIKPLYNNGKVGPKVTYSRQRSYRVEESLNDNELFSAPLLMSQNSFGKGKAGFEEEEDFGEGGSSKGMMKSIHELREAGENNRFLDDIEALFEDIGDNTPIGRRRSGYIELASKMRDKAFAYKFRANNFDDRLLFGLEKQTDEIICFALSYILCSSLHEGSSIRTISKIRINGSVPMAIRMLDQEKDISVISKDRKTNMSKAAQGMINDLRVLVEKSPIFKDNCPKTFSPRIMGLKMLELATRKLREAGVRDEILPAKAIKKLIGILKPFASLKNRASGKLPDMLLLELSVSILESYTIGSGMPIETQLSVAELSILADVLPSLLELNHDGIDSIILLILRLNINLTNHRPDICDALAGASLISVVVEIIQSKFGNLSGASVEEEQRLLDLDMLILSLGLMINFAELSELARSVVDTHVTPSKTAPLDVLLGIFLDRLERASEADSMEESQSNVAFGYLSILLGNLCQSAGIKTKLGRKMPSSTLTPLVNAIEEFIAHHRRVDAEGDREGGGGDKEAEAARVAFTERLEEVIIKIKE